MRETDWVSAHLFYHDDLDPLLVGLVAPLVDELAADGLCLQSFFLRYWDGGNHLRLRLLAGPTVHDQVRSRVADRCARFFQERPAPGAVDPANYLEIATRLARLEGMPDFARRPYPNNSVAFIPYRREHRRYGCGPSIQAVERHFVESSLIALSLLRAGVSPRQRDTVALSLLLLTWFHDEPDPTRLVPVPPASVDPAEAEQRYLRQQDTVRAIAVRMRTVASRSGGVAGEGAFAAWSRSIGRLRSSLGDSPTAFQVIDTCAHLVCNRLGVSMPDESFIRYLATRSLVTSVR